MSLREANAGANMAIFLGAATLVLTLLWLRADDHAIPITLAVIAGLDILVGLIMKAIIASEAVARED